MRAALLLAAALAVLQANADVPRRTQRCNPDWGHGSVIVYPTAFRGTLPDLVAVANDSARDPDLYRRLWSPRSAAAQLDWAVLRYEQVQDVSEIARALNDDPVLAGTLGYRFVANRTAGCFIPMYVPVTVTEYYNRILNHYFLSSSPAENDAIDRGWAGEGWERTGEVFAAIVPDMCTNSFPVFRFYAPGPNSHFFTVDPDECGAVRNHDPGWIYEGDAFGASKVVDNTCPLGTLPIYRLYNGRAAQNDSNHRFVANLNLYKDMQARGWIGEGAAFCLGQRRFLAP